MLLNIDNAATDKRKPSCDLLLQVRSALVRRLSSLTRWSIENGFRPQNVRSALIGDWRGPVADALLNRIVHEIL